MSKTPKVDKKIVVIGGGTGSFTMLSALKSYTKQLSAIVNMVDDGGSTGVLRDELGTLPAGDVRQCLVALSCSPAMRELFNYRFSEGGLSGHSFGNIFISALEKLSGNFGTAVQTASDVLRVNGRVIPATLDNVRLKMGWPDKSVILNGERVISADSFKHDPRKAKLSLSPTAKANPEAISAILQADMVIIAPGDLYSSLGPLLVISGIASALKKIDAKCVYVSNLVTKHGQTAGFSVLDHANEIERFVGGRFLDYVLYNKQKPTGEVARLYKEENAYLVELDEKMLEKAHFRAIAGDFLGEMEVKNKVEAQPINRSLIRHDSKAVAEVLLKLASA
jgi:uncharacterized cofD-like protein